MVVCGDDALAYRLTVELASLYGRRVTVVLPSLERGHGPRLAALEADGRWSVTVREAPVLDDAALEAAGVRRRWRWR